MRRNCSRILKLTGMRLGLLINFGAPLIKNGVKRLVNGL